MPTDQDKKLMQVIGLLETQVKNLESVIGAINFQVLGNADQFAFNLCTSGQFPVETQEHIQRVTEEFLKNPVRRQVGRLKNCLVGAQESLRVLKNP